MFTHFKNRVFFSLLIFSLFKIFRLDFLDFKVFSSVLKKKKKNEFGPLELSLFGISGLNE